MDYERAVASAKKGLKLMRPHWHWVAMSASEKHDGKLAMFAEDGHERGPYKPTRADRTAADWQFSGPIPDAATHGDGGM